MPVRVIDLSAASHPSDANQGRISPQSCTLLSVGQYAELLALPPHGSEVYVGGIPQDVSEEDLRGFCKSVGEVTEGKDLGDNKGYAFVSFRTKELASKAIEEMNNSNLEGRKIKCSTAQAKHRLFIGNVPKSWGEEDMKKVITEIGPGVISVELLKVKAVYVKNMPKDITQDQLRDLFEHHGKITKVVLPPTKPGQEKSRFGFVHFVERSSAMKALKNTEKYEIDGQVLECSLAKPQADQKSTRVFNSQKSDILPSYPPRAGYGMVGGAYGAVYGATGFAQPLIYGRGPTHAGMAMMPMLLPDGRIGYVLDLNPLYDVIDKSDYRDKYYKSLMPLGQKYAKRGKLTSESLRFFSPIVIWTKFTSTAYMENILYSAFTDYYKAWLELMDQAVEETDVSKVIYNREAQHKYLAWRAQKDPGHQVLKKLIGETRSKDLLRRFLFDGINELGSKTFLEYFPEYCCEDETVNEKRGIIGKSFDNRPWDSRGEKP